MNIGELDAWFSERLDIPRCEGVDASLNGLQIGRRNPEVGKVAFAVDACLETLRRAAEAGADMLFVHHGLLWGRLARIVGPEFDRHRLCHEADLALYAVHLPLDMHPELGNNAVMARTLGLVGVEPFGKYKGLMIGVKGRLPEPLPLERVRETLGFSSVDVLKTLPFGPAEVSSVGIVSGGATRELDQAIMEGLDLYITGDTGHHVYHSALEAGISVLSCGHYATETFGVRAVAEKLAADTGIETFFIDVPTGL